MKGLMVTLLILLSTGIVAGQQSNSNLFPANSPSAESSSSNFAPQSSPSRPMPDDSDDATTVRQEKPQSDRTLDVFLSTDNFSMLKDDNRRLPVPLQMYDQQNEKLPLSFIEQVVFGTKASQRQAAAGLDPEVHAIRGESFVDEESKESVLQFALSESELDWVEQGNQLKFIFPQSERGQFDRVDFVSQAAVDAAMAERRARAGEVNSNATQRPSPGPVGPTWGNVDYEGPISPDATQRQNIARQTTQNQTGNRRTNQFGSIQDDRPTVDIQPPQRLTPISFDQSSEDRNASNFDRNASNFDRNASNFDRNASNFDRNQTDNGFRETNGFQQTAPPTRDDRQNGFSNRADNQFGQQSQQALSDSELRTRQQNEYLKQQRALQEQKIARLEAEKKQAEYERNRLERERLASLRNNSDPRTTRPQPRFADNSNVRSRNDRILNNPNATNVGVLDDPTVAPVSSLWKNTIEELQAKTRRLEQEKEDLLYLQAQRQSQSRVSQPQDRNPNYQNASYQTRPTNAPIERVARKPDIEPSRGTPPFKPDLAPNNKSQNNAAKMEQSRETRGTLQAMLVLLLGSLGLNVLLGFHCRSMYARYEDLADELRETFTSSTSL